MDIEITDEILELMLAEVRSLSPEEAMKRLDRHRGRSIGLDRSGIVFGNPQLKNVDRLQLDRICLS